MWPSSEKPCTADKTKSSTPCWTGNIWDVSDEAFKAILTEDAMYTGSERIYLSETLAAYAQLFPTDSLSIAALHDLESWFRTDRPTRKHRDWDFTWPG